MLEQQSNKKQFSKNEIKIIIIFIALILGGLMYWLLISPQYRKLKTAQIDLELSQQDFQLKNQQLADLQEVQTSYQQLNMNDLNKLDAILPSKQDVPEIVLQMKTIVEKSGFILSAIEINESKVDTKSKEVVHPELGILKVDLKLAGGDYVRFKKLLDNFETSLPLVDIQTISFPQTLDSFNLNLQTYYLMQN
ncbi:MAG: type 4a pilus biogenesis protein PilO [Patescibacteria group bacterium]|nr:type 4a pilus biogenesis protein PilO [Patescibacteria group bacterium]